MNESKEPWAYSSQTRRSIFAVTRTEFVAAPRPRMLKWRALTTPRLIIIPHVHKRAGRRRIALEQIRQTALSPDLVLGARPNAKTGHERKKQFKDFGARRLCVVVEYRGDTAIAITTFWKK